MPHKQRQTTKMSVAKMRRLLIDPICERAAYIVAPLSNLQRQPAIIEGKN
jgi:hypothetical protein